MTQETIFSLHLVIGYVVWLLCFVAYVWPRLKAMDAIEAQRAIATLHSFRFFGLVFILPGVSGHLPAGFANFAAYGDFATGLLAVLALVTVRIRPIFWSFVVAFNVVGAADLIGDYYHAIQLDLPAHAGEFGALYAIPILYVPLLMITHVAAFYLLARRSRRQAAEVRPQHMIEETRSMKPIRNLMLALALTLIGAASMTHPSSARAQTTPPATTGVMVILTVKAGVTRDQVMAVMPSEIRETLQLYLNGRIREWYSRADGRGVVLLLDIRDVAEAQAIVDALPLAKQNLMDHEYIAVGPLLPLRLLVANP